MLLISFRSPWGSDSHWTFLELRGGTLLFKLRPHSQGLSSSQGTERGETLGMRLFKMTILSRFGRNCGIDFNHFGLTARKMVWIPETRSENRYEFGSEGKKGPESYIFNK